MIAHDGKKVDLVAFATYNRGLLRICNVRNVPIATNIATADLLVTSSLLTAPD